MRLYINTAILLSLITYNSNAQETKSKSQAYAEISVKDGGKWVGRKYEGGTFKNVQTLKLDPLHTDHSFDIRYEGPGWESGKIAYRLYLDWRNAIDLFGKETDTIILPKVGLDGFDSYHKKTSWGGDILKVGKGLGIGSIGRLNNTEVLHFNKVANTTVTIDSKPKVSKVNIKYEGWETLNDKINLKSVLAITANERYTKHTITPSKAIHGICTGIVKLNNTELFKKESSNKQWAYIATYGAQSIFSDNLGMAVFYQVDTVDKLVDGEFDHLIVFKPTTKSINYYFLGVWEKEKDGIKTKDEFINYLDKKLEELNKSKKLSGF